MREEKREAQADEMVDLVVMNSKRNKTNLEIQRIDWKEKLMKIKEEGIELGSFRKDNEKS